MSNQIKRKKLKNNTTTDINKIIKTVIQSEDTSVLPNDNYISIKDEYVQPLIEVIIKNLKSVSTHEKIRLLRIVKLLLNKIKILKNIESINNNLLENVIDYKKLMFLKGKILYMKNCLINEENEPENVRD
ncbi:hypothetical protein H312_01104 [Anncaliia algerae PRA339]|uniref:Small-subunit processome Utp12 domain-containing protein n=1 Tax=Anncaliia algerae PRA339 TaxID=1288291 RepID=A0A059F3J4_9MICR|nr:hypothetical protein H312_01104 [Anncaliia algerae PRA339]